MHITMFIYNGLTALDAVGPYEVLSRLPGARLTVASPDGQGVRTDNDMLGLAADCALTEVESCDLLLVPGGPVSGVIGEDEVIAGALRRLAKGSQVVASVCTGALILGAAGLLQGKRATTHWAFLEKLRDYGAEPVKQRIVVDGSYYSAAGVSAGIDMALSLAAALSGDLVAQAIQLGIEYDPQPPFDAGSPDKAPAEAVALLRQRYSSPSR